MRKLEFGIVGYGRFGRLLARVLSPRGRVAVCDRSQIELDPAERAAGIEALPLPEVALARLVLLAVPIRVLEATTRELAPHLRRGTIVADTASVKVWPARWLLAHLDPEVEAIATHPLFGPDSARDGVRGCKLFIAPLRLRHPRALRRMLDELGLEVIEATPDEHDREMAETQALTHWLGRGLEEFGAGPRRLDTLGYRRLLEILEYVRHDSIELFQDLERFNPHAEAARARFLAKLEALHLANRARRG
ncbi:MAG: prephenate dehydrogenase/arogenate dehydrogenase family protein [Candidatus Eisenbacteria bacterium]